MDFIKFLGTAGARFVVAMQLRASGGTWLCLEDKNILIDPGPGCLVKCHSSRPKLNPAHLHAIVLTHRHLDHSADVNVMIEAMTMGGTKKKGLLFAPEQALSEDPVVLQYLRDYVEKIEILKEKGEYEIDGIKLNTPIKHIHGDAETYGLNFTSPKYKISFIVDTRYFPELVNYYRGDILVINVVRPEPSELDHLCLDDAKRIIIEVRPRYSILTHFGRLMVARKPWEIAQHLSDELGLKVIAASDGMNLDLDKF